MLNAIVALGVVAIVALFVTAAVVGRRIVNDGERRVFRKWCGIWSFGVLLFFVAPGVLARLDVVSETVITVFPAVYVVLFAPTIGWFVNEMTTARKKGEAPDA
jgi:hypothetical protein